MFGTVSPYQGDIQSIVHPPLLDWLKRQVSDLTVRDHLFVYFHQETKNFIIAEWENPGIYLSEVFCIGPSLGDFTHDVAQRVLRMFNRPVTGGMVAKALKQNHRDQIARLQHDNDEEKGYRQDQASTRQLVSVL